MLSWDTFDEAKERDLLAASLALYFDTRDTFKLAAELLKNLESQLMLMEEMYKQPESEEYTSALETITTVSLKLKSQMLSEISVALCLAYDVNSSLRLEQIQIALKMIRNLRGWHVKHRY